MESQRKVRLGIIGTGRRGAYLASLYHSYPKCEVTALCDRFEHVAEEVAGQLGIPGVARFTSFELLIDSGLVDAVLIAAPPTLQVDIACYAMEQGIHVTTEVPAAYTIEQCWKLVRTVEKTGVKYQLCEQLRYASFVQEWERMARAGEFGKILLAEGEYYHYEENWRRYTDLRTGKMYSQPDQAGVDAQIESTWRDITFSHPIFYLPHTLSPLLKIMNDRVTHVSCFGTRPQGYTHPNWPVRDIELAQMRTSQDSIIRVGVGFSTPHGPRKDTACHWYQVKGTERSVEWSRSKTDLPRLWNKGDEDWTEMRWSLRPEEASEFIKTSGHGGVDGWPVETFVRAILEDSAVTMDVYDAVETAAPAILAAESSDEGGTLKTVPNFRK
ncbi:Gfo/Idh/MocA family protein [Paenibacillus eucommiae]|uniref:Dehydrogenase n=1 Tax=Paenibacillus eucommiae TaxID=1355755 RepID=A0ABS4IRQ2_9BACL|nr:Gfo/Idh/MocA family oxidoreductase [Paenibacillus eucommiae]MBP1990233.1 putative dehydrogenase [Paenibacillus eucommiae]